MYGQKAKKIVLICLLVRDFHALCSVITIRCVCSRIDFGKNAVKTSEGDTPNHKSKQNKKKAFWPQIVTTSIKYSGPKIFKILWHYS